MKTSKSIQTDPITAALTENQLNTVELLTDFFKEVYKKELGKNKVNESIVFETISKLPLTYGPNVTERCSYLYCYATSHTLLVKNCITRFLNEFSYAADLMKTWKSLLNISSYSFGPGLDYMAFCLAILEVGKDPTVISNYLPVLKSQKWIKSVKSIHQVLQEVKTPLKMNYKVQKVTLHTIVKPSKIDQMLFLRNSNVVLMFQPFSSDVRMTKTMMKKFVNYVMNGALIFSISPLSESSLMQSVLKATQGTFLYGPISVTSDKLSIEIPGNSMKSVPRTRVEFFVWVKDSILLTLPKCLGEFHQQDPNSTLDDRNLLLNPTEKIQGIIPEEANKELRATFEASVKSHHEELQQPLFPSDKNASEQENPPNEITILRNGLKKVEMFYSFYDDQVKDSLLKTKGIQTDLVAEVVLENKMNTNRLVTDFFMEVYKSEVAKFNVKESTDLLSDIYKLSSGGYFDDAEERCAYMYFYATCHTLLMKECFLRFFQGHPKPDNLLESLRRDPSFCSLSHGPGLDYIAFSLAVLEVGKQPTAITKAQIVTLDRNWKHTVEVLSEVIQRVKTPLNLQFDLKFTQHQDLSQKWKNKTRRFLKEASIVFMFKTLNLGEKETRRKPPPNLMQMVDLLAGCTLIFFMDSASSASVMKMVLGNFTGTFIFGPTSVIQKDLQIEVSEALRTKMELLPDQSAEEEFFVWKKLRNPSDLTRKPEPSENFQILSNITEEVASTSNMNLTKEVTSNSNMNLTKEVTSNSNMNLTKEVTSNSNMNLTKEITSNSNRNLTKEITSNSNMNLTKEISESSKESAETKSSDAFEPMREPNSPSTFEPLNSASNEIQKVSEPSNKNNNTAKEVTSDNNPLHKINSLIERIRKLATAIENDFEIPNLTITNEGTLNVTDINLLTVRINKLVASLESRGRSPVPGAGVA